MKALVAAILLVAGQSAETPILSVATAKRELGARDGQLVQVRGWVSMRCYALGCSLLTRPNTTRDTEPKLSIGFQPELERMIQATRGAEVVIEGVLDASCQREVCIDRAPELHPRRIVSVSGHLVSPRFQER